MPLNFPTSPSLNDTYTFNNKTWIWNGNAWAINNTGAINGIPIGNTNPSTGDFTTVNATGNISASYFIGNGSQLSGIDATSIQNGNSNVKVNANANVTVSVTGTSNVIIVSNNTVTFASNLMPAANVTYNLGNNTNRWNNLYLAGNTIDLGGALITSDGSNLSFQNPGGGEFVVVGTQTVYSNSIVDGNSNVVVSPNANVNISAAGNANVFVVTGTGANVLGNVIAGNVYANSGTIGGSLVAGTLSTALQGNITAVGTLANLTVSGNASAGNLNTGGVINATGNITGANLITGGQVAATGNITAGTGLTISNGGAHITGPVDITGNISVTGNFNVTGNLNYSNVSDLVVGDPLIYLAANSTGDSEDIGIIGNYDDGTYAHTGIARDHTDNTWKFFYNLQTEPTTVIDWANATFAPLKSGPFTSNSTITSVGNIITSASLQANGNVVANGNVTASNLVTSGTVNAGTLAISGNGTITGNLTVSGTTTFVNTTSLDVENPIIGIGRGPNNAPLTTNDGKDRGEQLWYYTSSEKSAFIGYDNSTANLIAASDVTIFNQVVTVNNWGNFVAGGITAQSDLSVTGNATITGNLTVTGNTNYTNTTSLSVEDPIIYMGRGANNTPLTTNDGLDRGSYMWYYTTSEKAAYMGYDNSSGKLIAASNVTVANNIVTVGSYGTLVAGNLEVEGIAASGDLSAANVSGGNTVSANYISGTLTTAAQPNITSTGTLTSLGVSGNITAANITANTGIFTGNGSGLSQLAGANVTGEVSYAATANAVAGSNVSGAVSYATTANAVAGANVTGEVSYSATANSVAGANVSGQVGNALVAGTVYTAAQPNITSVGTLTSLSVTGNGTFGNILGSHANGNSNVNIPAANGNVNISAGGTANVLVVTSTGANIAGTLNATGNLTAGNITTGGGSGGNITGANVISANTFNGVLANGNSNVNIPSANGNVNISAVGNANILIITGTGVNVTGTLNTTGIITGNGNGLSSIQAANITGTVSAATSATNAAALLQNTSTATTVYPRFTTSSSNGNSQSVFNTSISANLSNASITATTFVGALSGAATSATTAGTVTTAAQPNITSVGTLTGLTVSATIVGSVSGSAGSATTAGTVTTAAQPNITSTGSLTNTQTSSLGVGTAASGTTGEIRATNNITAYYSDDRLKTRLGNIENALDKVCSLTGFYYEANDLAQSLGYKPNREVGLSAQDVEKVLPEIVVPAPIDEKYKTLHYERMTALLVEAIKEIKSEINDIKRRLGD